MTHWKRQAQENKGNYFFNGFFICTQKVDRELSRVEILLIYLEVKNFAISKNGIDYLQIYKDEKNRTLYFIDNLSEEQILSGKYAIEDNYCTLLFSEEY